MKDTVSLRVFKHFVTVAYFKCFPFPDEIICLFFCFSGKKCILEISLLLFIC